jgi:GDP-L-fucose synthase
MFFKGKKVLVTGGTGFVGSHIIEALLRRGARVRVPLHRSALGFKDALVETIPADLTNLNHCLKVCEGVDYIIHAAGAVGSAAVKVDKAMAAITANLVLTALMLQAAWAEGVKRFLLFGSSTGYPASDYPIKEEEMWEAPPYQGYFGYGWMRRYLERLGEFVHGQSQMRIALVRPTAVYGRRDNFDPESSHVIPALIRRAAARENPFEVWGSGDVVRDFLHVSDLARACLLMLEKYAVCDPVNIGYGQGITIKEIVHFILEAAGHENAKVVFNTSKPAAIPIRLVDTAKAKEFLGFEPEITLKEGIRDTVDWYVNTQYNTDT